MKKFRRKPSSFSHADLMDSKSGSLSVVHAINKKKVLTWTASALVIVAAPVLVFAWSVDSTRLSNTSANPMVKADETAADSNSSSDTPSSTNTPATTPPVIHDNSNATTQGTHTNTSTTNVIVNDQTIPVPSNGTTDQTVVSSTGQPTQVVVQHSSSTNGTTTNDNSTNVSISSTSNSSDTQ
jgi:hypothetical protein